jgi:hypothetical protein
MHKKARPHFSTDSSPFLRTVSYRDLATPFTIAIVVLTIMRLIRYASNWVYMGNVGFYLLLLVLLAVLANHYFYWIEHKRFNNFIGRLVQDAVLFIFSQSIFSLFVYLEQDIRPEYIAPPLLIMGVGMLIFLVCFESIIEAVHFAMSKRNRRLE